MRAYPLVTPPSDNLNQTPFSRQVEFEDSCQGGYYLGTALGALSSNKIQVLLYSGIGAHYIAL